MQTINFQLPLESSTHLRCPIIHSVYKQTTSTRQEKKRVNHAREPIPFENRGIIEFRCPRKQPYPRVILIPPLYSPNNKTSLSPLRNSLYSPHAHNRSQGRMCTEPRAARIYSLSPREWATNRSGLADKHSGPREGQRGQRVRAYNQIP